MSSWGYRRLVFAEGVCRFSEARRNIAFAEQSTHGGFPSPKAWRCKRIWTKVDHTLGALVITKVAENKKRRWEVLFQLAKSGTL